MLVAVLPPPPPRAEDARLLAVNGKPDEDAAAELFIPPPRPGKPETVEPVCRLLLAAELIDCNEEIGPVEAEPSLLSPAATPPAVPLALVPEELREGVGIARGDSESWRPLKLRFFRMEELPPSVADMVAGGS